MVDKYQTDSRSDGTIKLCTFLFLIWSLLEVVQLEIFSNWNLERAWHVRERDRTRPCNHFCAKIEGLCHGSYCLLSWHTAGLIGTGADVSQTITTTASFGLWIQPHKVTMRDVALVLSSFTPHNLHMYHQQNRTLTKLCHCAFTGAPQERN